MHRIAEQIPASYWSKPTAELLSVLRASVAGLSAKEAQHRLKSAGPNSLKIRPVQSKIGLLVKQFANPLILILLFAVVVSLLANEWVDAGVILAIVVGSGLISFIQEYSAGNAVAKLRRRLTHNVTAIRDGRPQKVDAESIVPGDVVVLSAGSMIPADGVLLSSTDFFVNQAMLTGETFPVYKNVGPVDADAGLVERTNCVFMGTSARTGVANALIVGTGPSTEYGSIADQLGMRVPETEFERGIREFGILLTRIMTVLIVFVFAINVISFKPPIDSLMFAIALAVGISPELLPAIITINLAKGARKMALRGVIVRRLESIENLGSMDVLCTDKTGTLTEGVVRLDSVLDTSGNASSEIFRLAYLNAHFQTGLSNPLDEAITAYGSVDLMNVAKICDVPYDFHRKRLSVVIRSGEDPPVLISKGALDNILDVSAHLRSDGNCTVMRAADRDRIGEQLKQWSDRGFRVLGIATKQLSDDSSVTRDDEHEMVFEGFLLFFDPPKKDVERAIKALADLKVGLKIITGDNRHIAEHVAEKVGLPVSDILSGAELNKLTEEALWHAVDHTTLFAEVDPNQKERIIRALKRMGHVVGYLGDGINDAPALHDADVGISVEGAVDVAREAADIVLLHKGLGVLRQGIEEGRTTFANSLKYVFTTTSANFGNMFSMAAASLFLPFLPLLAKQILLNNFLSDIPAIAIANDNVDPEYVKEPRRWNIKFIRDFMILFGLVSSIFDLLVFGLLLYVIRATEPEFQTAWFIESLLTELLVALIVRTQRPFYRSTPGRWLWISTVCVAGLALAIPYLPYGDLFGFVPLPLEVMVLIIVVTLLYCLATEAAKRVFYKRIAAVSG